MNLRHRAWGTRAPRSTSLRRGGGMSLGILMLLISVASPLTASSVEEQVREITAELRCPVCQNLSVADSPSRMANQMRELIRERLKAGESPEAVKAYFVERYGEWILLAPKKEGFNLLVWVLPFLGMFGGALALFAVVRRWVRRPEPTPGPVDPAYLERVRGDIARDRSSSGTTVRYQGSANRSTDRNDRSTRWRPSSRVRKSLKNLCGLELSIGIPIASNPSGMIQDAKLTELMAHNGHGGSMMRAWQEALKRAERWPTSLRSEVGATLLELLVAASIFALVLATVYSTLISSKTVYARNTISFDMHTNAHFALPPITRALLSAGMDPTEAGTFGFVDDPSSGFTPVASDTLLTFTLDADGDGVIDENSDEIKGFRLAGAGPPFTLERLIINFCGVPACGVLPNGGPPCGIPPCGAGPPGAAAWTLVARQIQSIQFTYMDDQGNPLPNPATPPYTLDAAQRAQIRRIVVRITIGQTGTGFSLGGRQFRYTLVTDVTPRNLQGL